jgi:hypothetical protein
MDKVRELLKAFYETADCAVCFDCMNDNATDELREHEKTCELLKLQNRYLEMFPEEEL